MKVAKPIQCKPDSTREDYMPLCNSEYIETR
jgi:hypothetical protein